MAAIIAICSGSIAPGLARNTAFKSTECSLPRHSSRRPSTVTRTRLHRWQKLLLCGEIKPTSESLSVMLWYLAGPPVSVSTGVSAKCCSISAANSSLEQKLRLRSCSSITPSGISSIKAISIPLSRAKRTSSTTSSSLRPFNITALSLTLSPAASALSIPVNTLFKSPVRVMFLKRSASRLSRLIFMRLIPASRSRPAHFSSCEPLLVRVSSRSPGIGPMRSISVKIL